MPSFTRNTSGGASVSGGAKAPRSRRGNTAQADGYWRGGSSNPPVTLEYLVIAGGGTGGPDPDGSGGGGAGGYRTNVVGQSSGRGAAAESAFNVAAGTDYTVTVGGATSNSVFSTITSLAGGNQGASGGSGGGAFYTSGAGAGTSAQGGDGRTGVLVYPSYLYGGGGGGAGGAGGGQSPTGLDGQSSNITGSSVTRAGGGGGSTVFLGGSNGGAGGGGAGAERGTGGTGTVNTGSGGGGGFASGGSGIVIIRYLDGFDNIPNIGAGLTYALSLSGGYKIYSFTAGTGVISF